MAIIARGDNREQELADCKTYEDLKRYRRKYGMKIGWEYYKAKDLKIKIPKTK